MTTITLSCESNFVEDKLNNKQYINIKCTVKITHLLNVIIGAKKTEKNDMPIWH